MGSLQPSQIVNKEQGGGDLKGGGFLMGRDGRGNRWGLPHTFPPPAQAPVFAFRCTNRGQLELKLRRAEIVCQCVRAAEKRWYVRRFNFHSVITPDALLRTFENLSLYFSP